MIIYEGVGNETERADFSRNKQFNLFQGFFAQNNGSIFVYCRVNAPLILG